MRQEQHPGLFSQVYMEDFAETTTTGSHVTHDEWAKGTPNVSGVNTEQRYTAKKQMPALIVWYKETALAGFQCRVFN